MTAHRTAYFAGCNTMEEGKARYRSLALAHHPDRPGGNTQVMQEINAQWAEFQGESSKHHERARQEAAHQEGRTTTADYVDLDAVIETLKALIREILPIPGINVELCGLWIWVTGNTKDAREALKAAGLHYAPEKKAWYFAGIPSRNRKRQSLDRIRQTYGSQKFTREEETNP